MTSEVAVSREDEALLAEDEALLAVISAARTSLGPMCFAQKTLACPGFSVLLAGAKTGRLLVTAAEHVGQPCSECQFVLRLVFAEVCPSGALLGSSPRGALGEACRAHQQSCQQCNPSAVVVTMPERPRRTSERGQPTTVPAARERIPSPIAAVSRPPIGRHHRLPTTALALLAALGLLVVPAVLARDVRPGQRSPAGAALCALFSVAATAVVVGVGDRAPREFFDTLRRWWVSDPTIRLGTWLACTGIAVSTLGLLGASYGLPMGPAEVGLGVATFVVGTYFAWGCDPFQAGRARSKEVAERQRRVMAAALLALAAFAGASAKQFRPPLGDSAAKWGMVLAAIFTASACVTGVVGIALHGKGWGAEGWGPKRLRRRLIRTGLGLCGAACVTYAATHLFVAAKLAPTSAMRAALVSAAAALTLTAYESAHRPDQYLRLIRSWVRWGFVRVGDQDAIPPEPRVGDLQDEQIRTTR